MSNNIIFNIIEKNKSNNTKDIEKKINIIINKLIKNQFFNLRK